MAVLVNSFRTKFIALFGPYRWYEVDLRAFRRQARVRSGETQDSDGLWSILYGAGISRPLTPQVIYSPARSYFACSRPTIRFSSTLHAAETRFGPFEDVRICQFERP